MRPLEPKLNSKILLELSPLLIHYYSSSYQSICQKLQWDTFGSYFPAHSFNVIN